MKKNKGIREMELEIEELKQKNTLFMQEIENLTKKIYEMNTKGDIVFSPMLEQFQEKIEYLEKTIELEKSLYKRLQQKDTAKANKISQMIIEINELKKENVKIHKLKNERGAGRKGRFTTNEIEEIKALREKGFSIAKLAEQYKCSVGLIHKIVK